MPSYQSWGRLPKATPSAVQRLEWRSELADLDLGASSGLPYGLGRSYGDSCLNDGGILIDTSPLARLIDFDAERGIVRAEAGLSLERLLAVIVPRGWFLPVSPGTQFVTLGGAVANDIHGKNHHHAGTFGRHVRRFELWRSDGSQQECSPDQNAELFRATIGGMGLTGLITWVEIQLVRIASPSLQMERIRFRSFDEYLALGAELNVLPFTTVILPPEIIDAPKHKSVCFHPSLLPAFRGGSALAWQIIEGVLESGVSVFQPDDGVDTGPLYLQKGNVPISPIDNTASLYFDKLYPIGVEAMVETVAAIDAGTARLVPQQEEGASFQGLIDDEAARLDLKADVVALDQRIRGCDPQPGAWLRLADETVRLYGSRVESQSEPSEPPGTVLAVVESGLLLATRGGVLRIQKVRRNTGKSVAHESGLEAGDRLL